jgi:tetratricopeptide (TPR) repeat protein
VLSAAHREDAAEGLRAKLSRTAVRLRSDPEQFASVMAHYADSVEAMLDAAPARRVPVVLATVPVNLRDWHPNVSLHAQSGDALDRWREAFDAGRGSLLAGDPARARARLEEALALEPLHAETRFELGRALEAQGDPAGALARYREAVDLDHNPFRALSEQNALLRALAARKPGVALADLDAAFVAETAPRAPGFDLLLDYVHPTERGNALAARVVFDALVGGAVLGPVAGETRFRYDQTALERGYDEARDARLQQTLLALFVTMHQYQAALEKARAIEAAGADTFALAARVRAVFEPWLELERRRLLGLPIDGAEARRVESAMRRFYAGEADAASASPS